MAGEYMNPMGSYPQYGMAQQQPFDALQNQYLQLQNQRMQQLGMLQNPYQQQYRQPTQPQNSGLTVRPATNIQEVQATPIELMTTNIFVNLAQGEIYLSRINDNGLKDIQTFRLSTESADSVVKESLTTPAQIDLSEIHGRFDRIESLIGGKPDESDAAHSTGNAKRRQPASGSNAAVGADGADKSTGQAVS